MISCCSRLDDRAGSGSAGEIPLASGLSLRRTRRKRAWSRDQSAELRRPLGVSGAADHVMPPASINIWSSSAGRCIKLRKGKSKTGTRGAPPPIGLRIVNATGPCVTGG